MLLMVEKGTKGGIGHAIRRYGKANNKYMKNYDKNKESCIQVQVIYIDGQCLKNCLQVVLNEKKAFINLMKTSQEISEKHDEDSEKGYILEVDVECSKNLLNVHSDLPFLAERKKTKKMK